MRSDRPIAVAMTMAVVLFAPTVALPAVAEEPTSLVSQELFRYSCRSEISVLDLTLFGNGTLRLRDGKPENVVMRLLELGPGERDALVGRLRTLSFEDADSFAGNLEGAWLDQCRLILALPNRPEFAFRFHRFDSLSLGLQRGVDLGNELAALVLERAVFEGLPRRYEPRVGDFLRRADGEIFEVVGFTSDGLGLELHGYRQPTGMYIAIANLRRVFVALEEGLP